LRAVCAGALSAVWCACESTGGRKFLKLMTLQERSDLVLAFARILYVNGQSTEETLAAAERLGDALGLRARISLSG